MSLLLTIKSSETVLVISAYGAPAIGLRVRPKPSIIGTCLWYWVPRPQFDVFTQRDGHSGERKYLVFDYELLKLRERW